MAPTLSDRGLRRLAWVLAAFAVVAEAATPVVGSGLDALPGVHGPVYEPLQLVQVAVWCPAALLVISARPRNPIGWLLLGVPLLGSVQNFAGAYGTHAFARPQDGLPLGALAVSLGSALWPAALFLPLTLMLVRYPSGALPSRRWRWADRAAVAGMVAAAVGLATAPDSVDDWTSAARPVATLPGRSADLLWSAGAVLLLAVTVLVLGNAALRTARARGPARAQLLLLALTGAVLIPCAASPWNELFDVALFLVPIAVAVGVLRYNLLGIEVVVRRALLYGLLTIVVAVVYAAVVALVSVAVPHGPAPAVVAAALVAVGLLPVRERLQTVVDVIVYGERRDPVAAVTRLGADLPDDDPLPTVIAAVARSLGSPYVAVTTREGVTRAATAADVPAVTVHVPLRRGEAELGELVVAPRVGDERLDAADRRLLDALAVQVAAVVRAVDLGEDLAAAHSRTLAAAKAERDRLRHDLHDGLGPSLTGIGLGLEAAETAVGAGDADRASAVLTRLRVEVVSAVEEIRRILDGLRPPALDRVGLVAALRERAAVLTDRSGGLVVVEVDVEEPLPVLDPETETAAYRIAEEALTNSMRHSGASRIVVRVEVREGRLAVRVSDDGCGLPSQTRSGVGLESMQRRAESLGGSFGVRTDGGVHVTADLPGGGGRMTAQVRVVLADDHPMFRFGVAAVLQDAPEVDLVGQASDGAGLVAAVRELEPDVVLTDLAMPGLDGVAATRELLRIRPDLGVLVLTMHDDDESVFAALRAGARGYLLKGAGRDELVRAVLAVAAGEAVYGATVARRIVDFYTGAAEQYSGHAFPELTPREREVLDLLAAGRRNSQIAAALGAADKTVRNHVSAILLKLQVPDRTAAAVKARDAGLGRG